MKVRATLTAIRKTGNWTGRRCSLALSFLAIFSLTDATLRAQYTITPVASGGGYAFDGRAVAVDRAGNVYATAKNGSPFVVKMNASGGAPAPIAGSNNGSPNWGTSTCNTTSPSNIGLSDLGGLAVDGSGNVYVAQSGNSPIVDINGSTFTCPFGNTDYSPNGIAVDNAGNIYFADTDTGKFYKAAVPFTSIGGNCTNGAIQAPFGLAADSAANLYVADNACNVIWKVIQAGTAQQMITPVAGNLAFHGTLNCAPGSLGDGGLATNACLDAPEGVAVDPYGNLYIADRGNSRVRKVDVSSGNITTIATSLPAHSIAIGPGGKIYAGVESDPSMNFLYELTPPGAMIVSPAPGSMLRPPVTFTWSGAPAGSQYQLEVGEDGILPGTYFFTGTTTATTAQVSSFGCDDKTITAQLTTTNAAAGVSQSGVYTYTACMLTLSPTAFSVTSAGGPVTINATVTSQTSQTVTLNLTELVVYPPQPCYMNYWMHTIICPTPALIGSKSINLMAGVPQTVPFTVNFGNFSGYLHVTTTTQFTATLTGANGTLDSAAIDITQY